MQAQTVTILDPCTGRHVTGKLIKRYPLGLTIEDTREIRYYATLARVVEDAPEPDAMPRAPLAPGDNGNLWQ